MDPHGAGQRLEDARGGRSSKSASGPVLPTRAVIVSAVVIAVPSILSIGATSGHWPLAVGLGAGVGALVATILAIFASRVARGDPALFGHVEWILPEETLERDGLANHVRGIEAVGGKLYLTKKRLRFVAHHFNIQVHDTSWPLDEIESVEAVRTLFVIPNGLRLTHLPGARAGNDGVHSHDL